MRSPAAALVALVVGLGLGILTAATSHPLLTALASAAQPVGALWINGIRMTVVPLVMSLVLTGVAADSNVRGLGRLGARVLPVYLVLLLAGGVFAALLAYPLLGRLAIDPEVAARVREGLATAPGSVTAMPSLTQRIIEMVPYNPVRAAADGAMLPLIVFAIALGAALASLDAARREPVVRLFRGIADAMLVLVQWVLALAPIGILALTFSLGAKMGAESVGALLYYVVVLSLVMIAYIGVLYPIAVWFGGVALRDFAAAVAPAQAVAISSRSSLAALPSLITGARQRLQLPAAACDFLLPLSVAVFRCNVSLAWVVGVLFLGQLYGVPIDLTALVTVVLTSSLISFSVPGLPSASLYLLAPFLVSMGIPAEGAGILIALDLVPDMFKTTVNVTSQLASTTIAVRRGARDAHLPA